MDLESRHKLTFEQAEGVSPLPRQLALKELDRGTVVALWAIIDRMFDSSSAHGSSIRIGPGLYRALLSYHVEVEQKFSDEFTESRRDLKIHFKSIFGRGDYAEILGFLQHLMRTGFNYPALSTEIDEILTSRQSAYRVVENRTIIPFTSEAETATIVKAFSDLEGQGFAGAKAHLVKASGRLSTGDYADAIRESIHAVDAVARKLAPTASDLGPALTALQNAGYIHRAMRTGFSSLYGYASDEKGIRHALIDDAEANVTEVDALYMFGACASFVTYLIGKAREFQIPID